MNLSENIDIKTMVIKNISAIDKIAQNINDEIYTSYQIWLADPNNNLISNFWSTSIIMKFEEIYNWNATCKTQAIKANIVIELILISILLLYFLCSSFLKYLIIVEEYLNILIEKIKAKITTDKLENVNKFLGINLEISGYPKKRKTIIQENKYAKEIILYLFFIVSSLFILNKITKLKYVFSTLQLCNYYIKL
ncbi:hypothetical protein [Mesoplasma photuris]|uniref:hypothetical protein n=1 Tax=Mesoplasma photuris TaxID=217731 RepID=UPI0012EC9567|nr:hypothetical protein [Mesoplasma photuris]